LVRITRIGAGILSLLGLVSIAACNADPSDAASGSAPILTNTDGMPLTRTAQRLAGIGPIDPATTFPANIVAEDGTILAACLDPADPLCGPVVPPMGPPAFTLPSGKRVPSEFIYYSAVAAKLALSASVSQGAAPGSAKYIAGILGGFILDGVAISADFDGQPLPAGAQPFLFSRLRLQAVGVQPGTTLQLLEPYGTDSVTSTSTGVIRYTQDNGMAPALAANFTDVFTKGNVGFFLRQMPQPDARHLGNPGVAVNATGNPNAPAVDNVQLSAGGTVVADAAGQFQITGKVLPTPDGFFTINGEMFHETATQHYCSYADFASYLAAGGPSDLTQISRFQLVPTNLTNDGPCAPPPACGALVAGETLTAGHAVPSCNGQFTFNMQHDGNVVYYHDAFPVFNTATFSAGSHITMQSDGNLVVYSAAGAPVWNTGTFGHPGAHLAIQNDGNLVVYGPTGTVLWNSGTYNCGILFPGQTLTAGNVVPSCNRTHVFVNQYDGNIVYLHGNVPVFYTGTNQAGARLVMQDDGNLVLYNTANVPLFNTGTEGHPGAFLAVQNDGNLVVYGPTGTPLWTSNTAGK
jgi:hypothetical protein